MSESRITVAKTGVRAILDVVNEVGGDIDDLLHEDPAFSSQVMNALQRASSQLLMAANAVMSAHAALRTADRIENPREAA